MTFLTVLDGKKTSAAAGKKRVVLKEKATEGDWIESINKNTGRANQ